MKIIEQRYDILTPIDGLEILKHIELCGRICYRSEGKITDDSYRPFMNVILTRKHESVLEHFSISVKFITDRAVTHEIVRHRLAAYSQESQRYCNYSQDKFGNEVTFIKPSQIEIDTEQYDLWKASLAISEAAYNDLLEIGTKPEVARSVLPNSTKTEIVMTANLREWRHVLKLRTSKQAHPDMQALMKPLLAEFQEKIPLIFEDINKEV